MNVFSGTLFLDCDGVLANFDKVADEVLGMPSRDFENQYGSEVFWEKLKEVEDFFYNLPLMDDAMQLWDAVKHLDPIILTGSPSHFSVDGLTQKIRWGRKNFPEAILIPLPSKHKARLCKPGDIIVDDWPKHLKKWKEAGGHWILHTSARDSIKQLRDMDVI